jgi:SAM-dependent methyltransferase
MVVYYFGIYHWQRRARSLVYATVIAGVALWARSRSGAIVRAGCSVVAGWALCRVGAVFGVVLSPPPWRIERYKYDALANRLPLADCERLLDIGCGTGRSLVGLVPHLPPSTTLYGLDVFDDRVILGNGPALARRNAALAGSETHPIRGDAARLPVATGSMDVVTACRVLHDLTPVGADRALAECRRVCAPEGRLGVLELPLTPGEIEIDPEDYWRDRVLAAGLTVERLDRLPQRNHDGEYLLIVAAP